MEVFSGFYDRSIEERQQILQDHWKTSTSFKRLPQATANMMIENYIGNYALPLGIATNFVINEVPYLIPMATEEPSVVAAASNGAKHASKILTQTEERFITGQIVLMNQDLDPIYQQLLEAKDDLLVQAKRFSKTMVARGGGPKAIRFSTIENQYLTLYLDFDPCDAMGANSINTVLEGLAQIIQTKFQGEVLMSILSNYAPESLVTSTMHVPIKKLDQDLSKAQMIAERIVLASHYAKLDPYRAATHNKGIMNGIDAVVIATGNDSRAVEASVHSYASESGSYRGLSQWEIEEDELIGRLSIPMPIATVGGTLSVHPTAQWALALLNNPDAKTLSQIIVSVGLAQNFAALKAIVTDGIQKGHMKLQARSIAIQVGAQEDEIEPLIEMMASKNPTQSMARRLLKRLREEGETNYDNV